ncbi:MAG: zinc metalloprotease HtpX [Candidatus Aenigmatarchaeota archaeon]
MSYGLRTVLLLGLLTAIFLVIGFIFGGILGMTIGLILAFIVNFVSYWYSDKFVLALYRAKELENKKIDSMIEKLAKKAGIPKPKTYIVDMEVPNAFATGRNPKHAAVAVTSGLLDHLNENEIEGVLAHEIAHIKNRDTLIQTLAATIAGAISWIAYIFYYGDERNRNAITFILLFILAPIAAMLIKLAISRNREYVADKTGAMLSDPLGLANALEKISLYVISKPIHGNAATSHLFIVNPFTAGSLINLFSTHPPIEERIRRLKEMKK